MKIGIDIDEILVNSIANALKMENRTIKPEEIDSYHISKVLKISHEESLAVWKWYVKSEGYDSDLIEGAADSLRELSKNHELFFITSRSIGSRENETTLLRKKFAIKNPKIFYTGEMSQEKGERKLDLCKKLDIDLMIEDTEDVARQFIGEKIKLLLFDKPWNVCLDVSSQPNLMRVDGWKDALAKIEELKK